MQIVEMSDAVWSELLSRRNRRVPHDGGGTAAERLYGPLAGAARSFVMAQVGQSLDGRVATPSGDARDISGKKENKRALMQELELDSSDDIPLLGIVSRLTSQKGIDLIQQVVPKLIQQRRFALAVLGSGEPRYEKFFGELKGRYRNHVCFYRGFSNKLAHMIEAGSDMFLMPSQFEPCGLNQMYSLRYGTVPIVRRTGGLADSVQLFEPSSGKGTGIVFDDYSASALEWALNAALDLYQDKKSWRKLVRNGMAMDYSWKHQGQIYIDLFRQILPTGK